jgi:hypothetical protein
VILGGALAPCAAERLLPEVKIVSRSMLSIRPPAFTMSGCATANPARTMPASILTVNPCALTAANVRLPRYRPDGLQRSIARSSRPRSAGTGTEAGTICRGGLRAPRLAPLFCAYGSGSLANSSAIRLASSAVRPLSGGRIAFASSHE